MCRSAPRRCSDGAVGGTRASAATHATELTESTIRPVRRDRLGGGEQKCRFWRLCQRLASAGLSPASFPNRRDGNDKSDQSDASVALVSCVCHDWTKPPPPAARGWRERRCRGYLGAASSCRAWGRPGASGRVDSMHADGSPKGGTCRDYLARLLRGWPLAGDPARVGDAHRL